MKTYTRSLEDSIRHIREVIDRHKHRLLPETTVLLNQLLDNMRGDIGNLVEATALFAGAVIDIEESGD